MLFVAQLWKYNSERLESKNGDWMYMEETWLLPNENKPTDVRKTSKMGLAKLFSYKTKKADEHEGQAIRNSLGHLNAYSVTKGGGMHSKLIRNNFPQISNTPNQYVWGRWPACLLK